VTTTSKLLNVAAIAALALVATHASAQYPDRPITMIVPYAAGGGTDATGRILATKLEKELGKPVNVANRVGGGGVTGHAAIASSPPDGYTIGIMTFEISTYAHMGQSPVSYRDFTPIALYNFDPASFHVRTDSPWRNAKEAIAAIKASPEKYKMSGGGGVGGSWHLATAGLFLKLGIDPMKVAIVPSNGAAPGMQELVAGGVDFIPCSVPEARPMIEAGRARSLYVQGTSRIPAFPDIPTVKEAIGVDHIGGAWRAVVGPKGMPADVTAKLAAAIEKIHQSKEFRDFMNSRGFGLDWKTGPEFARFLETNYNETGEVVKAVGLAKKG
jgi:tripartite-type tricarboxylate transporter receptor subunit TctC